MSKNDCCESKNERIGNVGGQAVLEGVMMRAGERVALSVRNTDGKIVSDVETITPPGDKNKFFKLPIIRGIVGFVMSMKLSISTLNKSLEMLGIEEEEPSKFEIWLEERLGKNLVGIAAGIGTVLGLALSIFLFMFIPTVAANGIFGDDTEGLVRLGKSAFSGVFKIGIFLLYIWLVSLIPDIKRTFQYHGAEHKSIFCHEKGLPLTVENVLAQKRFHPRCGTSFLVVMMILGIFTTFFFVNIESSLLQTLLKIFTLPIVVGLGFEFIRYAGRHDNTLVRILSAPGLWIQRLTTKEPDESQVEVAINSLKAALPDMYPEIVEELKGQSRKPTQTSNEENASEQNTESKTSEISDAPTSDTSISGDGADAAENSDSADDKEL